MKSKKELLKSPKRNWNDTEKEYNQILLVPAGTKHDSGYMHIAIIGVTYNEETKEKTYEICAYPDDIACYFPIVDLGYNADLGKNLEYPTVRMDCYYPQGILQYHGRGKFKVGLSLSSTDIYFTPDKKKN